MKLQIINGTVILPTGVSKANIYIEDDIIKEISHTIIKDKSVEKIDAKNKYVLPGFIDLHTNGINGFDLTNGVYNPAKKTFALKKEEYLIELDNALKAYAIRGTTLIGFTTLEASVNKLKRIFNYLAEYKSNSNSMYNDVFHGIYMEGTFMKDREYKGAHNPKYFFEPSIKLFDELQEAANGLIKIVNVVPEWGSKALKLIQYLSKRNILCAAGHTSASGKEYNMAIDKGLKLAIHVLNGPSSSSFKPFDKGGALESLLRSDKMNVEIIPDGYHVDKSYLLDIIKRKGIDKCIAISDSMFSTNIKNVKEFTINGVSGKVSKNGEYIHIVSKENINSLFGSTLTMDKAFANLLTWFTQPIGGIWNEIHQPVKFEEALVAASKMCSLNPAMILHSTNNGQKTKHGSIEKDKKANVIITDITKNGSSYNLIIDKVLLNGKAIFSN